MAIPLVITVTAEGVSVVTGQITQMERVVARLSNTFSLIGTKINNQVTKPITNMTEAIQATNFTNLNNDIKAMGNLYNRAGTGVNRLNKRIEGMRVKVKKVRKRVVKLDKSMGAFLKNARGGMMGLGFGALFLGMAMNRAMGSFLRSTFDAYKMVNVENSIFTQKTNELAAAWTFFKFALIDSLNQSPLFATLIDHVISLVQWFGKLSPHTQAMLLMGVAVGWTTTKVISWLGQLGLVALSLIAISTEIKTMTGLGMISWIKKITVATKAWALAQGKLIFAKLLTNIKLYIAALKDLGVVLLANPLVLLAMVVIAIVVAFAVLVKMTGGVGNAFKAMGLTLLLVLTFIGDAIIESMLLPIRLVIIAVNLLIDGWNLLANTSQGQKAGMKTIDRISQPDLGLGIGTKVREDYIYLEGKKIADEGMGFKDAISSLKQDISDGIKAGFDSITIEPNTPFNATTS